MTPQEYYFSQIEDKGVPSYLLTEEDFQNQTLVNAAASAIGIDPAVASKPIDIYNTMLDLLISQLPSSEKEKVAGRVFAGVFPTGQFNAEARRVPDGSGYVFFLNTGLNQLIYAAAKLIHCRAQFATFGPDGKPLPETASEPTLLTHEMAAFQLKLIIQRYLTFGQLTLGGGLPLPLIPHGISKFQLPIALLVAWTECFVLAHELAHALLGHLDRDATRQVAGHSAEPFEVISKSQEEELLADFVGLILVMTLAPKCPFGPLAMTDLAFPKERFAPSAKASLAGPFFFTELGRRVEPGQASTHPPYERREQLLNEVFKDKGIPSSTLDLRDTYVGILRALLE